MGLSKEVFLKMSEEHYMAIPDEIRSGFLTQKRIDSDGYDWQENMKDPVFKSLQKQKKEIGKQLEERQYQLREERRQNKPL